MSDVDTAEHAEAAAFANLAVERLTASWTDMNLPPERLAKALLDQGLALAHVTVGPASLATYLGWCLARMPSPQARRRRGWRA